MKFIREIAFASALTLGSLFSLAGAIAAEVKLGDLVISNAWSRQSPMAANVAAGFLTITNTGQQNDRLVKAETTISTMTQLHDMKIEGDVMKMFELPEGIPVPAGGTVELRPRSLHLMFMELAKPPAEGERFTATLTFEKAGTVDVEFAVLAPGAQMNSHTN